MTGDNEQVLRTGNKREPKILCVQMLFLILETQ
jgi:hypothetical protein